MLLSSVLFNYIVSESPINVTLSIVRDEGTMGDVFVHYKTVPALGLPPANQATENEDYMPETDTIIMRDGATSASVTITILPVSYILFG